MSSKALRSKKDPAPANVGAKPRPATILVVDDDDAVRETITSIVRSGGHETVTASGGAAAFASLNERVPDLILCDRMMPGMSGYDLLEKIRAERTDLDAVPFVFLTALRDSRDMQSTAPLRPTAYLTKPVRARTLLDTIGALLGIDTRRDQVDGLEIGGPECDAGEFELVSVSPETR